MRIHYLQHVPFEGIGSMESYFISCGYRLGSTQLYLEQPLPKLYDFDWLIVMGGPMGVGDELQYSWMSKEKSFIKSSIESGKIVAMNWTDQNLFKMRKRYWRKRVDFCKLIR